MYTYVAVFFIVRNQNILLVVYQDISRNHTLVTALHVYPPSLRHPSILSTPPPSPHPICTHTLTFLSPSPSLTLCTYVAVIFVVRNQNILLIMDQDISRNHTLVTTLYILTLFFVVFTPGGVICQNCYILKFKQNAFRKLFNCTMKCQIYKNQLINRQTDGEAGILWQTDIYLHRVASLVNTAMSYK